MCLMAFLRVGQTDAGTSGVGQALGSPKQTGQSANLVRSSHAFVNGPPSLPYGVERSFGLLKSFGGVRGFIGSGLS